jgi:hypothetical protein
MTQRHAPSELYRHIIKRLQLTDTQQQTIAHGLTIFHELLLNLKAQQTRLQQQLQQQLQQLLQQTQQRPAEAAAAATPVSLQEQQQQQQQQILQALLARQDDLTWLQPEQHAAAPTAAATTGQTAAASNAAELLPLLGQGQSNKFDQQHQLLQRVETNNWQLSWIICLLNFFISGVLDLRQLCKCAVYSYPWPWWPGPFAEEVLRMYQEKQQSKQQQQQADL